MKEISMIRTNYSGTMFCLSLTECEKLGKIYTENEAYGTIYDNFKIPGIGYAVCKEST